MKFPSKYPILLSAFKFLCLIIFIMYGRYAYADPFGLKIGTPLSQLEVDNSIEYPDGKILLKSVPKPHEFFKTYIIKSSKKTGLCYISAFSEEVTTDSHGTQVKSKFNNLKRRLSEKYGKPTDLNDSLKSGSIWNQPEDWVNAIKSQDRKLHAFWNKDEGKIELIGLSVFQPPVFQYPMIVLDYSFNNYDACEKEIEKTSDQSL